MHMRNWDRYGTQAETTTCAEHELLIPHTTYSYSHKVRDVRREEDVFVF